MPMTMQVISGSLAASDAGRVAPCMIFHAQAASKATGLSYWNSKSVLRKFPADETIEHAATKQASISELNGIDQEHSLQ